MNQTNKTQTHKKLKILHITEATGGGVFEVIKNSINHQQIENETLLAYSPRNNEDKKKIETEIKNTIKIEINLSSKNLIKQIADIRKIIRQTNPDAIHLHSSKAGFIGRISSKLEKKTKRTFYTPHGFAFLRKDVSTPSRVLFLILEKIGSRFGGKILACSKSEEKLAKKYISKNTELLENAIDPIFKNTITQEKEKRKKIITIGRICKQKNPNDINYIAKKLKAFGYEVKWIGDGDNNLLKDEINFKITGWMDNQKAREELKRNDIFILTSLWEGMPLALMEAQSAGLICIAYNINGCNDIIENNKNGFLVENKDQIIKKILELTPEKANSIAKNAIENAVNNYSIKKQQEKAKAIYIKGN